MGNFRQSLSDLLNACLVRSAQERKDSRLDEGVPNVNTISNGGSKTNTRIRMIGNLNRSPRFSMHHLAS